MARADHFLRLRQLAQISLAIGTFLLLCGFIILDFSPRGKIVSCDWIGSLLFFMGGISFIFHFALLFYFWYGKDKRVLIKTLLYVCFIVLLALVPNECFENFVIFLKKSIFSSFPTNILWFSILLFYRCAQVIVNAGVILWPFWEGSPFKFIFLVLYPGREIFFNKRISTLREKTYLLLLFLFILAFIFFVLDIKQNLPFRFFLI